MVRRLPLSIALVLLIFLVMLTSCGATQGGTMVTEIYTVQAGDTLWTISENFIQKNTYGPRDVREFYQGIIEINQNVFAGRMPGEIHPGDQLTVIYWSK